MLKNLPTNVTYGIIALFIAGLCFIYLWDQRWDLYPAWLVASNISAFAMCWIVHKQKDPPMAVIYWLAILGGFIGAWLGMFGFWFKISDIKFWLVLILITVFQGAFIRSFL